MIGETVSHYRVLSRLGSGGMGDVYLAEDTRLGRNVALKTLKRTCCTTEARARLLREARVLSQLNHPGIAVVYDVGERLSPDGDEGFLAMEYVAGETLEAAVARGRLPLEEAVRLITDVAEALGAAHARGVVHRDVKPGNVMVDGEGRVKVLDFGLALEAPRAGVDPQAETIDEGKMTTESLSRGIVGTVAYMSPEQARGRPLDARTDVFSLGVVLYQLLSGRLPFRGANLVEQLDALLNLDPEPLAATNDAVSPSLDAVVRKMLEKERERRHADMKSVARDLAAALSGKATSAASASPSGNTVAVMGFRNITGESEDDWLGTGIAETVTADLQGVPGLVVIGRERIFEVARKVGGKASDPDERLALAVGREVGARWVVSGGYQRVGAQIRLTARVLDAPSGALLQTVKLDGPIERIFELQDRIVRELSCCWRVEPEPVSTVVEEGETHVIAAYEAFAKGMINLRAETRDALDRAILFFERAVQLDPRYARAHQRLGSAFDLKATYLVMPELLERAVAAYRRSLELDPASAETWRELGSTQVALGQEDEALVSIRKALALDPTSASAHGTLGRAFLIGRGEFQNARASFERAVELNPQAGWFWLQLSHTTALLGDLETAESAAHRAITLQEEFLSGREGAMIVGAYVRLGHRHALSGRYEDALLEYERELGFLRRVDHALKDRVLVELDVRIGSAHRRLDQHEAAGNALRRAVRAFEERLRLGVDDPFTRYYTTVAWTLLGEEETALASLAKTVEMKPRFTRSRARVEPDFEKLRDRAPFRALIGE